MINNLKAAVARLLPENKFARGVVVLSGGTASVQLLLVCAAPILTRLYTPEDFGLLAVFVSILGVMGIVACLRYELAIPIAEDDNTALHVVMLCLIVTFLMTFLSILIIFFGKAWLVGMLNIEPLENYLFLLPLGVMVIGFYQTFSSWAIREKAFGLIAKTKVIQSISSLFIQLSCFKFGFLGLLAGYIASQSLGTLRLAKSVFKNATFRQVRVSQIKSAGMRYKRFPIFSTWDALLNTSSLHMFPIALAVMFGPVSAGLYALAMRVLLVPTRLIGHSFSQVFLSSVTQLIEQKKIKYAVEQLSQLLTYTSLPIAVILFCYGEEMFGYIFGAEWRQSGEIVSWMSVWLYFQLISSPISTVFIALEKQSQLLVFQFILFSSRMISIIIGSYLGDFVTAVALFSVLSSICYILFSVWIFYLAGANVFKIIESNFYALLMSIILIMPLIVYFCFMEEIGSSFLPFMAITIVFFAIYYYKIVRVMKDKVLGDVG